MNSPLRMKPLRNLLTVAVTAVWLFGCSGGDSPEKLLAEAKTSLQKNDRKAAEIHLKNLLQQQADNGEARYLLGKMHFDMGDFRSAEKELARAVESRHDIDKSIPLYLEALLYSGDVERVQREGNPASVTTAEAKAQILHLLGRASLGTRKIDDARAKFREALVLKPDFDAARVGMGLIMVAEGKPDQALAETDKILAEHPKSVEALMLKADLLIANQKLDEGQKILETLVPLAPNLVAPRSKLAAVYIDKNLLDDARKQVAEIRKLAPESVAYLQLLAQTEFKSGNYQKADEALQAIIKAQPDFLPALTLAANIALIRGNLEIAEQYSRTIIAKSPQSVVGYRMLGAAQLRLNQPAEALATAEQVLTRGGKDSVLYAVAGEAALKLNQHAKAETYFREATSMDPNDPAKRTGLAVSRLAGGNYERGIADLEAAVDLDSKSYQADYALVMARIREKRYDKALEAIRNLEKKPNAAALAANLEGLLHLSKNENAPAKAAFEKALQKDPKFFPATANLAGMEYRDNKPDEARKRFEALVKADPKNVQALLALSQHAVRYSKDVKDAATFLETARRENPTMVQPVLALANFRMQSGEPKQAATVLQEGLQQIPDNPELLEALGLAQIQGADRAQALVTFQKLVALRPNNAQAHFKLGEVQVALKDEQAAFQSFRKSLELQPKAAEPRIAMAQLHLRAGRREDARKIAQDMQKELPNSPAGLVLEGDLAMVDQKWAEASSAYRRSLEKNTNQPATMLKLHQALMRGPKPAEGDAYLEKIVKDNPNNVIVRTYAAEIHMVRGDFKTALEQYKSLLEKDPRNPLLLNNVAWVSFKAKDPKALELAEQAFQIAPQVPQVMDTLGVILVDQGKTERGISMLRQAVAAAPKSAELRLHLAEALQRTHDVSGAKRELEILLKDNPQGKIAETARQILSKL